MKLQTWQVAARPQVSRKTVVRWEKRGLLSATKDERGHRWYDADHIDAVVRRVLDREEPRRVDPVRVKRQTRSGFDIYDTDEL